MVVVQRINLQVAVVAGHSLFDMDVLQGSFNSPPPTTPILALCLSCSVLN
jgi:hypothetical protein